MAWRLEDGVTQCSFRRNIQLPEYSERFDLDRQYYIFLADGKAVNGEFAALKQYKLSTPAPCIPVTIPSVTAC